MYHMMVSVTQEDIDNGESLCTRCPIALAVRKLFPNQYVTVCPEYITVYKKRKIKVRQFKLPQIAEEFIKSFDNEEPVQPIGFMAKRVQ